MSKKVYSDTIRDLMKMMVPGPEPKAPAAPAAPAHGVHITVHAGQPGQAAGEASPEMPPVDLGGEDEQAHDKQMAAIHAKKKGI